MRQEIRARLFALIFVMTRRRTAGLSHLAWLRLGLWLLALIALLVRQWPVTLVALGLLLLLTLATRWARQNGYATFTPLREAPDVGALPLLPGHQRLPVRATGLFSAGRHEHYVLLRPAECWHIPIDEHAVMVESGPGRYLYQFVQPDFLDRVQIGHFLFGRDRLPGLEITYRTDWSPQLNYDGLAYYVGGGKGTVGRLQRKIYLTFADEKSWLLMWKSFGQRTSTAGQNLEN